MCGRFSLTSSAEELATLFDLDAAPELPPRYNIAPTQLVAAVRFNSDSGQREMTLFRWGLIPFWSKDLAIGSRLINARSETVAEKPAFRAAFKSRRCLIPASGFYEWQKQNGGKQPHLIGMEDGKPFAMAGMWEHWEGGDGSIIESCTILTTTANKMIERVHNRMPVILDRQDFSDWLDPATATGILHHLLRPYPAEEMMAYPVSTIVNSPVNDVPACVEPLI
ncbi:MAG: SOS response-associated peptidase [Caldilineales bacterium]|nr:SOS response-associated peptidase [Caldilineales bacterium]